MKKLLKLSIISLLAGLWALPVFSQCDTWLNKPDKDALEEAHVLYRQFMKTEDFENAFSHWKYAYEGSPAADGQRSSHYSDGRTIYINKFKKATDDAQRKEYADVVIRLFDEQVRCYPAEKATALGMKAYEMFYTLNSAYDVNLKACSEAVAAGGMNTSYVVFQPYASIVVYQFQNKLMQAEEARNIHTKLNEIADHNIAAGGKYDTYYQQAKEAMNGTFAAIESEIFDCNYFKAKFEPDFRANPNDHEALKYYYNKLTQQGCPETDPFMMEVKQRFDEVVGAINAAKLEEYYAANPGEYGIALFKEGKNEQALDKFEAGIRQEEAGANDKEKLANYYFYMASVEFRQLGRYADARNHARKAAGLKPGWGQPYMLIGDMYAKSSSSCGSDNFEAQLAILAAVDKYAYARSIDSDVSAEANKKIGGYAAHYPEKAELFQRGLTEGQSMSVPCWIGETVSLRAK